MSEAAVVGIDVGGTNIAAGLVVDGVVVARNKTSTPKTNFADFVAAIAAGVLELAGDRPVRVGLGVPGPVDHAAGVLVQSPNLPAVPDGTPLAAALTEALVAVGCKPEAVLLDNDVNVTARAASTFGAASGAAAALVVSVGTGIGGALVFDGALHLGPAGGAGEFGHMVVAAGSSRVCGCGGAGHIEAFAGRAAMESEARRRIADGEASVLADRPTGKPMTSKVWFKAADTGDPLAMELLATAMDMLGCGIAAAAALCDFDRVVLAGGMVDRFGDALVGPVTQAFGKYRFGTAPMEIVASTLGDDGPILGAASLAQLR